MNRCFWPGRTGGGYREQMFLAGMHRRRYLEQMFFGRDAQEAGIVSRCFWLGHVEGGIVEQMLLRRGKAEKARVRSREPARGYRLQWRLERYAAAQTGRMQK